MSPQSLQSGTVETLQRVLWFVGESEHAVRPVELIDARPFSFAKRKYAKLVAVEGVHRARYPTCSHSERIQIVLHSRSRCGAVRQLVSILSETEQLFPATVCHENVLPLVSYDHDFEILCARMFNHADKILAWRVFASQHFQNVDPLSQFPCASGLGGNSEKVRQAD